MSAVPVEGDRERPKPLSAEEVATYRAWSDEREPSDWTWKSHHIRRLLATLDAERAGVSLTGSGLREAAQAMVDPTGHGEWYDKTPPAPHVFPTEFCDECSRIRHERHDALVRALSGESGEPKETER